MVDTNSETCFACKFEAKMGTREVPHPLDAKLHRCKEPNPDTAWTYDVLEYEREQGAQSSSPTMPTPARMFEEIRLIRIALQNIAKNLTRR